MYKHSKSTKSKSKSTKTKKPLMNYFEALSSVDAVKGTFIELGFGKGVNLKEFISYMNNEIITKRDIWLYDSFEGYNDPVEEDGSTFVKGGFKRPFGPAMDIRHTIKTNVTVVKGFVEDTFDGSYLSDEPIAIAHMDLVSYSSTLFSLNKIHSKLAIKGIAVISGYKDYKGVKLALDKFLKDNKADYKVISKDNIAVIKRTEHKTVKGFIKRTITPRY